MKRLQFVLLAVILLMQGSLLSARSVTLPPPDGPLAIGYMTVDLPTPHDDELTSAPDDKRILNLEIWYPAAPGSSDGARPLFSPAMQDALSRQFPFPAGFADGSRSSAELDASPAGGRYPVVLFSPGLSFPVALYQSLAQALASHGYVFVGVNHPHGTSFIEYADGSHLDNSAWPAIEDESRRQAFLARHAQVWETDLQMVLDWLRGSGLPPGLAGMIAGQAIGGLGHSYGGTAMGRLTRDGLVDAAVILEGAVRDPADETARGQLVTRVPLMHVIGGYNRLEHEGEQYLPSPGAPVYQAVVSGTGHAELSDLILLYAQVADADWHARHRYDLDPDRVQQIVADHARAMFDHYLKGEDASVLLRPKSYAAKVASPREGGYPEVDLSIAVD